MRFSTVCRTLLALSCLSFVIACGDGEEAPPQGGGTTEASPDSGNFTERVYERNVVFASVVGDSAFFVPWMMHTVETPDTVLREAHAWLARSGVWDGFVAERWGSSPTRSPSRIQPHGGLQLFVRDGGAIDGLLFEEGPRELEVLLDDLRASWVGAGGGSYDVLSGAAYLADQRIDGMVLDMSRSRADGQAPGGDWAFLVSGDSAQFVIVADAEHGGDAVPTYRGWGTRAEEGDMRWGQVDVEWIRTEAFPPARRDVPAEWRLTTENASLDGTLEALSGELIAGEGPGPLLPVRALFEVTGTLDTSEGSYPVYGLFVHERR